MRLVHISRPEPSVQDIVRSIANRFCAVGCPVDVAVSVAISIVYRGILTEFAIVGLNIEIEMIVNDANAIVSRLSEILEAAKILHDAAKRRLRALSIALWVLSLVAVLNLLHLFS